MTPRTFFTIFLKVMGVYVLAESLSIAPQLISTAIFSIGNYDAIQSFALEVLLVLVVFVFYYYILRLLFFKTDYIIDTLALDKHFIEEKFEINIHRSTVLRIVVIVIGWLMIVDSIPSLSRSIFQYIQEKHFAVFAQDSNLPTLIYNAIKLLLGFALVTNSRLLVNFIEKQRRTVYFKALVFAISFR